jgi:hypothetical protein
VGVAAISAGQPRIRFVNECEADRLPSRRKKQMVDSTLEMEILGLRVRNHTVCILRK